MAVISGTTIALRFFGDDLDPDELTAKLGMAPTKSETKGQRTTYSSGSVRTAKTCSWIFSVPDRAPGDLEAQMRELFGSLNADLSVWRELADKYKPDLFVGIFMKDTNEGDWMSAGCLELLSARGVSLSLDIYGPLTGPSE